MHKIISRPNPYILPQISLPVYIRSTGYNEADPGWQETEAGIRKSFVQIFWTIQGTGEFQFQDRSVFVRADEAIYRMPGENHIHRSVDSKTPWHYYWFTFDGPGAADFMKSYGYPQTAMHCGMCPVHLFCELEKIVIRPTSYYQRHAISVASEILALMGSCETEQHHDIILQFLQQIEQNYSDPGFTVDELAESMNIHRSTLFRIVKRVLEVSPKQYLQQLRIQKALSMLLETDMTVKQIAGATGFNKVDHFCALIQHATGKTPRLYRKSGAVDSM